MSQLKIHKFGDNICCDGTTLCVSNKIEKNPANSSRAVRSRACAPCAHGARQPAVRPCCHVWQLRFLVLFIQVATQYVYVHMHLFLYLTCANFHSNYAPHRSCLSLACDIPFRKVSSTIYLRFNYEIQYMSTKYFNIYVQYIDKYYIYIYIYILYILGHIYQG